MLITPNNSFLTPFSQCSILHHKKVLSLIGYSSSEKRKGSANLKQSIPHVVDCGLREQSI